MQRSHVCMAVGVLVAAAAIPPTLLAQGFSVNEHGTCAMGRAGTATAMPCPDGSAMFFNPAGLTQIERGRTVIGVGGTFIAPGGSFMEDATGLESELKDRVFPVPHVYLVRGLTDRVTAGLGLFAPYGLTTDWPEDALGRFGSYKSVIRNIYVQPTLAAKLGKYVSVGAGFDLNLVHLQLKQRLDLATTPTTTPGVTFGNLGIPLGTEFADVDISGNGTGVGYHVGVTVQPTDRLAFGIRYLSRQHIDIDEGEVKIRQVSTGIRLPPNNPLGLPAGTELDQVLAPQFQAGGPLVDQGGRTEVRIPEQLSLGVAYKVTDRARLMFDYTTTNWEVWDTIVLDFDILPNAVLPQEFERTHVFRFGGEYDVSPSTVVRLGYLTHGAAAPDQTVTPTLPEGPRSEFTAGLGTRLGPGRVDLAYQYIDQADRRGRSGPPGTPNNGLYSFNAHLFGATYTLDF